MFTQTQDSIFARPTKAQQLERKKITFTIPEINLPVRKIDAQEKKRSNLQTTIQSMKKKGVDRMHPLT